MNREYLLETQKWVKEELERCVNFWLKNGMDEVNGGVYTCLDRTGKIYSTDIKTIDEVNNIWKEIYKKYYPTNNYDLDYFKKGILWQADINRIDDPFYGIDYALAEVYALSFYQKYSSDKEKGIEEYISFCKDGGEIAFKEIAKKYNLLSPFNENDLILLANFSKEKLEKIIQ